MDRRSRFGYRSRWLGVLLVCVVVLVVALVSRDRPPVANSRPPVANTARASAGIGCFLDLQVKPATAVPSVTQAEAEARARTSASGQILGQPGALLDARPVTVIASGLRHDDRDPLAGQEVWLLHFAFIPVREPQELPVTGGQRLRWQYYAVVDAGTGMPVEGCASPLPVDPQ